MTDHSSTSPPVTVVESLSPRAPPDGGKSPRRQTSGGLGSLLPREEAKPKAKFRLKNAMNKVRNQIKSNMSGVEHYPELTGTLLSFLNERQADLANKALQEDALVQLNQLTKKVIIQLPKHSALEKVLEAHGWNGTCFDVSTHSSDFTSLVSALGKLYYTHVWAASPMAAFGSATSDSGKHADMAAGLSAGCVNIFKDERLVGAFAPNVLYTLMSRDDCNVTPPPHPNAALSTTVSATSGGGLGASLRNAASSSRKLLQISPMSTPGGSSETSSPLKMSRVAGMASSTNRVGAMLMGRLSKEREKKEQDKEMEALPEGSDAFNTPAKASPARNMSVSASVATDGTQLSSRRLNFHGACLLADISGFTKLSSKFCERGLDGLDDLHAAASGFLGKYVQIVYSRKGDVISFAGDALICIFVPKNVGAKSEGNGAAEDTQSAAEQMKDCCQRAVECALALVEHFTEELTSHCAISCGEMSFASLGGYKNQWTYLLNGPLIKEISSAIEDASSKQLCVTSAVYNALFFGMGEEESIEGKRKESGNYLVTALKTKEKPALELRSRFVDLPSSSTIVDAVKAFIPRPVLYAITSGTLDTISELRAVTTMFLKLDSYDAELHTDPLTLQHFFFNAQVALVKYGGFMRQFLVDDKGCVLIAMWGVPSFTYSNNASRAVAAAIAIHRATKALGHACSIGITSGNVFCGNIGSLVRRDFVGIGADVNKAARLMGKSKGTVYMDEPTVAFLPPKFRERLPRSDGMKLKGYSEPVYAHIADGTFTLDIVASGNASPTFVQRDVADQLVRHLNKVNTRRGSEADNEDNNSAGRVNGMSDGHLVDKSIQSMPSVFGETMKNVPSMEIMHPTRRVYCTLVEGQPGSGKSAIVSLFKSYTSKCRMRPFVISARPGDQGVQHGVLRKLFVALVGASRFTTEQQQRSVVQKLVELSSWVGCDAENVRTARLVKVLGLTWEVEQPVDEVALGITSVASTSGKQPPRAGSMGGAGGGGGMEAVLENIEDSPVLGRDVGAAARGLDGAQSSSGRKSYAPEPTPLTAPSGEPVEGITPNTRIQADEVFAVEAQSQAMCAALYVLLSQQQCAVVIEDAHFCDETTWYGLYLLMQKPVSMALLITARNSSLAQKNEAPGMLSPAAAAVANVDGGPKRRNQSMLGSFMSSKSGAKIAPGGAETPASPPPPSVGSIGSKLSRIFSTKGGGLGNNAEAGDDDDEGVSPAAAAAGTMSRLFSMKGGNSPFGGGGGKTPKSSSMSSRNGSVLSPAGGAGGARNNKMMRNASVFQAKNSKLDNATHHTESFFALADHSNTLNIELQPLNFEEVKRMVAHELPGADEFSDELISIILEASVGNMFWCKEIASFILERGRDEFLEQVRGKSAASALSTLVICRLEKLTTEQQVVLKAAAVVGEEFTIDLLQTTVPRRVSAMVGESLAVLVEHNFLVITEDDTSSFAFPNQVIRNILYDLTPPRERSNIHRNIAEQVEGLHGHDLHPYYALLAYHYGLCQDGREKALEYNVKSADLAVGRALFTDAIAFLQAARGFAQTRTELAAVLLVVHRGLKDIRGKWKVSRFFKTNVFMNADSDGYKAYVAMENSLTEAIDEATKAKAKQDALDAEAATAAANAAASPKPSPMRAQMSSKLKWQPSYTAGKIKGEMGEGGGGAASNMEDYKVMKRVNNSNCAMM